MNGHRQAAIPGEAMHLKNMVNIAAARANPRARKERQKMTPKRWMAWFLHDSKTLVPLPWARKPSSATVQTDSAK